MKKFFALALALLCVFAVVPMAVSAADNVVFVKDGGTGDGATADTAVGTFTDAYAKLDLSTDATVVICGPFTQSAGFAADAPYTGKVTITSVYGGVDYRATANAALSTVDVRFVMMGPTTFENLNVSVKTFYLIVAQHNALVIGEGMNITGGTGEKIGTSFSILGGYQNGQSGAPASGTAPVNVTVLSGERIVLTVYSRQIAGADFTGAATINVGGTAKVSYFFPNAVNNDNTMVGDITLNLYGNATIEKIYGGFNKGQMVNSFTCNWTSGTLGVVDLPGTETTYTKGTKLVYGTAAAAASNFSDVSAKFDTTAASDGAAVVTTAAPVVTTAAPAVTTAAPAVTTAAPATTTAAPATTTAAPAATTAAPAATTAAPSTNAPQTSDSTVVILGIAALAAIAVCVTLIARKQRQGN